MRRLKPVVLLTALLAAPSAGAEAGCSVAVYVWELELTRVEGLAGTADLKTIAAALGTRARLRGGYHDPAHPKNAPHVELLGSTDGAGLSVSGEKKEP
jgi:hypothetical protein